MQEVSVATPDALMVSESCTVISMDFTWEEKEVGWGWLEFAIFNLLHQEPGGYIPEAVGTKAADINKGFPWSSRESV